MYQRKGQIHQKNINIDDKGFSINENQNIGFILEEFDNDGKSLNVLKNSCIFNKCTVKYRFYHQKNAQLLQN